MPQKYRKKASQLLKEFNVRGNELTYDSSGVIYIDGVSIPNSDIFVLFPYLFKAKRRKNLVGFEDFYQKIVDMGLLDFIYRREVKFHIEKEKKPIKPKESKSTDKDDSDVNWWFLD